MAHPTRPGTSKVHGAPLGADEIKAAREQLGWDHAPFEVPTEILDMWRITGLRGCKERKSLGKAPGRHRRRQPNREFERRMNGDLPEDLDGVIADYKQALAGQSAAVATRNASQALEVINPVVNETSAAPPT
jgi:transketolase